MESAQIKCTGWNMPQSLRRSCGLLATVWILQDSQQNVVWLHWGEPLLLPCEGGAFHHLLHTHHPHQAAPHPASEGNENSPGLGVRSQSSSSTMRIWAGLEIPGPLFLLSRNPYLRVFTGFVVLFFTFSRYKGLYFSFYSWRVCLCVCFFILSFWEEKTFLDFQKAMKKFPTTSTYMFRDGEQQRGKDHFIEHLGTKGMTGLAGP